MIAGGRLLLASLFVIAVWADSSQPARAPLAAYALITAYLLWAIALTLLVWHDWWRDARLAAPAHVIDVAVFMVTLYSTDGYTSPYFTFFVFVLLSAAIRWGWRETAITAGALIAIYLTAGLILGPSPPFDIEHFVVRTGQLLTIASILVWFGGSQGLAWRGGGLIEDRLGRDGGDPFVAALRAGMALTGAGRAALLWRESADEEIVQVTAARDGTSRSAPVRQPQLPKLAAALLFDLRRDRALMRAGGGRWHFLSASEAVPTPLRKLFERGPGLAVPIAAGTAEGIAVFQDITELSTDHLGAAPRLEREIAERLQSAALFAAAEERSMAKARVAVARDLHDSVVQFLAGLGFRLEALKRLPEAEGAIADSLAELKDNVMDEQRHLRAFIRGLRTGGSIPLDELEREGQSLCRHLARQWSIECAFACTVSAGSIPVRTHLDIQQLVREAVANSARHGGASRVEVALAGDQEQLRLAISDDGRGFIPPPDGKPPAPPASLAGRVRDAGGKLDLASSAEGATITILVPVEARA